MEYRWAHIIDDEGNYNSQKERKESTADWKDLFNDWYTKEIFTYFEMLIYTQYIPGAIEWIDAKNNPELKLKLDFHLQVHGYV